jgi:predicted metalloprotease
MRGSDNLEDREGAAPPGRGFGGGVMLGGAGLIVVAAISLLLGLNPLDMLVPLQGGGAPSPPTQSMPLPAPSGPALRDETNEFVVRIQGDTEDTWSMLFGQVGMEYRPPRLVLFRGAVESACGLANSAVGAFYCSTDSRVYLDRSFFEDLAQRFGAPGEFARAYVIAHEIGHHVQNQLGITQKMAPQRAPGGAARSDAVSVSLELQADCFAGIWGHFARRRNLLEPADVEAGIAAAAAIGDDRIRRQSRGHVSAESFTHGSSAQRVRWFRTGLDSGDVRQCNTFATARP